MKPEKAIKIREEGREARRYFSSNESSVRQDIKAFKALIKFAFATKKPELVLLTTIIIMLRRLGFRNMVVTLFREQQNRNP